MTVSKTKCGRATLSWATDGVFRRVPLTGAASIGSGEECSIRLHSPPVPRIVVVILPEGNCWNLRSVSGIAVHLNGAPCSTATLADGDEIVVANHRFWFHLPETAGVRVEPSGDPSQKQAFESLRRRLEQRERELAAAKAELLREREQLHDAAAKIAEELTDERLRLQEFRSSLETERRAWMQAAGRQQADFDVQRLALTDQAVKLERSRQGVEIAAADLLQRREDLDRKEERLTLEAFRVRRARQSTSDSRRGLNFERSMLRQAKRQAAREWADAENHRQAILTEIAQKREHAESLLRSAAARMRFLEAFEQSHQDRIAAARRELFSLEAQARRIRENRLTPVRIHEPMEAHDAAASPSHPLADRSVADREARLDRRERELQALEQSASELVQRLEQTQHALESSASELESRVLVGRPDSFSPTRLRVATRCNVDDERRLLEVVRGRLACERLSWEAERDQQAVELDRMRRQFAVEQEKWREEHQRQSLYLCQRRQALDEEQSAHSMERDRFARLRLHAASLRREIKEDLRHVLTQRIALEELADGLRNSTFKGQAESRLQALRREYAGRRQRFLQTVHSDEQQLLELLADVRVERQRLALRGEEEQKLRQSANDLRVQLERQSRQASAAAGQLQGLHAARRLDREYASRFIAELRGQVENLSGTLLTSPAASNSEAA